MSLRTSDIKMVRLSPSQDDGDDSDEEHKRSFRKIESRSLVAFSTSLVHSYRKQPQVIILVGLPATGKSYFGTKLVTYLNWIGYLAKLFRLKDYTTKQSIMKKYKHMCPYFKENYAEIMIPPAEYDSVINDLSLWIQQQAEFIILDGLNLSRNRRENLAHVLKFRGGRIMYVEIIASEKLLDININAMIVQRNIHKSLTAEDCKKQIQQLAKDYDTINETDDTHYIKLFDGGDRLETKAIHGCRRTQVLYYIANYKQKINKAIYLVRSGETVNEMYDKLGGDSDLSPRGKEFSIELAKYIENEPTAPQVWTSSMKSAIQTGSQLLMAQTIWKELDEMNLGIVENMKYNEIKRKYHLDLNDNLSVRFFQRFPGGENFEDLIKRLEPILMQMEQRHDLIIISHTNIIKCIFGYLQGKTLDVIPDIEVPLHTVIKLTFNTVIPKLEFVNLLS